MPLFKKLLCCFKRSKPSLLVQVSTPIQVDGFELLSKIGQGATSCIYLAKSRVPTDESSDKNTSGTCVAIKASLESSDQLLIRSRFQREADVVSRLKSPHAVRILAHGQTANQQPYLVMEHIRGFDLALIIRQHGPMPDGRLLPILMQLCEVVGELHQLGIVHGDIKLSNIMLCSPQNPKNLGRETVKLIDFGLAFNVDNRADQMELPAEKLAGTPRLLSGTPLYSAPETWQVPSNMDLRSDIYSIGCCAYHLLTGNTVFQGNNALEICSKHIRQQPVELAQLNLPIAKPLAAAIMQCLSKSPSERPQSVRELADALSRIVPDTSWTDSHIKNWWETNFCDDGLPIS